MFLPRTVMNRAWAMYRAYVGTLRPVRPRPFDRTAFAQALSSAWLSEKKLAERDAREALAAKVQQAVAEAVQALRPAKTLADLERDVAMAEAIAWTAYLPAHMSQTRAIADIRARYGVWA